MEVKNYLLGYEDMYIYQNTDYFNFSLDSVLLPNFVTLNKSTKKILDIGCGNAPIPLYLTLRTDAHIVGVEVQEESYDLGIRSIKENNLEERIDLHLSNLIDVHEKIGRNNFEIVTCNPPFFKVGDNHINPNDRKAIARHEVLATLDDIVKEASILLNPKGRLAMVHRPDRLGEILEVFKKYKIEPKRLRFVYPKIGGDCNHILIEGIKDGSLGGLIVLPPLIVYNEDGVWTEEVIRIYNCSKEWELCY